MFKVVKCMNCGKAFTTENPNQLCCDKKCYDKFRYSQRRKTQYLEECLPCKFGVQGVACNRKGCSKCGWNPEVSKRRLDKIRANMEAQYG